MPKTKPISDLVEVLSPDAETTEVIPFTDIAGIVINTKAQTAYVRLTTGRRLPCTNPGAVRDAWRTWKAAQYETLTVTECSVTGGGDRPIIDRVFDSFDATIKKFFG
jgi:hypothetical protein